MELGAAAWTARLARTPFAAALAKGAPLLAACGNPPQVIFATPSALAAFGARDAHALQPLLFDGETPNARMFRRLAAELPEDSPPRLERFRYFVGRKPVSASWLCARLRRDGETVFVAADAAAHGEEPRDEAPPPPSAPPIEGGLRFVWRLDEEEKFDSPDPALAERLGPLAPRQGETVAALTERLGLSPDWREQVKSRRTFSGLRLVWPLPEKGQGRVARLSGAPSFGSGRAFRGFRGFGVLTDQHEAPPRPSRAPARLPENPEKSAPPPARAAALKPVPGDAAALLNLLQRQHAPPAASAPGGTAPALAVISALAALLQQKAGGETRAAAPVAMRPKSAEVPPPSSGAEIVVLRPHAGAAAADGQPARPAREGDSVALTSKERDAFKEIARALGVNARPGRAAGEPFADSPRPETEPVPGPTEEDLAALLDILPIAALVLRGDDALYANQTLLDLAGYADLADFRARDGLKALFRGRDPQALAPGGAVAGIPVVAADERILTVDAQIRSAVWRGAPAALIAMRRSREAEHQAELRAVERETAMHAARARDYAAALDAARDGMVRIDRNGRILGMNRGAETLFGYDQKEAAGDSFLTLLAPASQAQASAALESVARGEAEPLKSLELVARAEDGRQFPVRIDIGRLANQPDPDYFLLLTDRTAEEAGSHGLQAALDEAEKVSAAKTELLSRVSHEVRTPLHAILGFAEVILEERFGPIGAERYRDYIRDIHTSGRHVLSLVNDLLDLTKVELGKIELQFAPIDVNAVVRECVTLMQPQAARERVIMRLSLYERLPNVMADARSLKQIMLNLMANAVKYNEPGGQVIVSTALDDAGSAVIRVRDTGVGMSESDLAIALEPFRRVPGAKPVEGTGLGLPLTKALVEANHADFSIKSRKNQGTLVEIAFPARRAAQ